MPSRTPQGRQQAGSPIFRDKQVNQYLRRTLLTDHPPSSVACGATFPLEGEGFWQDFFRLFFYTCKSKNRKLYRRNNRTAMFAQPKKAFPFEGEGGAEGDG